MSSPASDERHRVALRCETGPRWLPNALAHLDAVLVDHAHCEKKAAANALSLLQAYPEVPGLPAHMARLAREEPRLAGIMAFAVAAGGGVAFGQSTLSNTGKAKEGGAIAGSVDETAAGARRRGHHRRR